MILNFAGKDRSAWDLAHGSEIFEKYTKSPKGGVNKKAISPTVQSHGI